MTEAHKRTKEISAKYADSLYKRKAKSSAPTAKPKTTSPLSGNHPSFTVTLPAPKRKRLATAGTPATASWDFNRSPVPVRHDASIPISALMQLQNAVWNSLDVKKIIDISAHNPTCDDGHVVTHDVLEEFIEDADPICDMCHVLFELGQHAFTCY